MLASATDGKWSSARGLTLLVTVTRQSIMLGVERAAAVNYIRSSHHWAGHETS